jgi:segregation and condensation protein B
VTAGDLSAALEAVLFVAGEPVPLDRLRHALSCGEAEALAALDALDAALAKRGGRLARSVDGYQLVTAPEFAEVVERFLRIQAAGKPSPAALETLAIVAHRQPVSRVQIEEVRGVNCERVLRALVANGLIQEVGRATSLGRPVLYGTTDDFLQRFGLRSLSELPDIPAEASPSLRKQPQ